MINPFLLVWELGKTFQSELTIYAFPSAWKKCPYIQRITWSKTRMHSSRMRTGRSLSVSGGVYLVPGPGGCTWSGGVSARYDPPPGTWPGTSPPPVDRHTLAKNITLAQLRLRPVIMCDNEQQSWNIMNLINKSSLQSVKSYKIVKCPCTPR